MNEPVPHAIRGAAAGCTRAVYVGGIEAVAPQRCLQLLSPHAWPTVFAADVAMDTTPGANPLLDLLAACAARVHAAVAGLPARLAHPAVTPALIGQGFGAMLAAELACLTPDPAAPLVLISPLGLWLDAHPLANLLALGGDSATALLWHNPDHPAAQQMRAQWPPHGLNALSRVAWPFAEHGLRLRLRHLQRRVLVIAGADDRYTPPAYAQAFVERLPGAALTVIAGCGHLPMLERPDETAAAIDAFLATPPSSTWSHS
jgi:pimeloyl-ACP methyl ester carboxylesterase